MSEIDRHYTSPSFLLFIRKWKYVLITVTLLAMVLSYVFSLLIEDKYVSSVIFFPTSTSSISQALLTEKNYNEKGYLEYGEEAEVDQTLQLLKSAAIRNHIIQKFDLINHYGINRDKKYTRTELNDVYKENIDFFRTKYLSIKVEVRDRDPKYASDIANEIVYVLDSVKMAIQRKRAFQAFEIVEEEYSLLKEQLTEMEDSLNWIRNRGVQDYETQVEVLTDQYGAALVKNNRQAAEQIKSQLDTLSKYGEAYLSLSTQLRYDRQKLSELRKKLAEARVNAFAGMEQKFIVDEAVPAEKPTYPMRWLIVSVSTLLTFLFTLMLLMLIDPKP